MSTAREETARLADLLRCEHHALAEFLVALSEFDGARRWEELGYASLFDFLKRELRLSNGAAQNRKTAAALIRTYPEVGVALREGKLCLSSVNEVAKVLTPENAAKLLPRFFGLSARDAAFVSASIRPVENPPRRDFLVTPVRSILASAPAPGTCEAPQLHACEVPAAPATAGHVAMPPASVSRPSVRPLDAERARVSMTVSRHLLEKLAAARDALSHSHPGATEETILEVGLDLVIERHRKRRGIGCKPRKLAEKAPAPAAPAVPSAAPSVPPPPPRRSRHVPAAVWRTVWERDGGRCAWPLEGGGVCGSTRRIELDHIKGLALGAGTTVEECRLLCRPHQLVSARKLYGDELMDRYVGPKGRGCSEPVASYGPRVREHVDHAIDGCSERNIFPFDHELHVPPRGTSDGSGDVDVGRSRARWTETGTGTNGRGTWSWSWSWSVRPGRRADGAPAAHVPRRGRSCDATGCDFARAGERAEVSGDDGAPCSRQPASLPRPPRSEAKRGERVGERGGRAQRDCRPTVAYRGPIRAPFARRAPGWARSVPRVHYGGVGGEPSSTPGSRRPPCSGTTSPWRTSRSPSTRSSPRSSPPSGPRLPW